MIAIDTNVVLRIILRDDAEQHDVAVRELARANRAGTDILVNDIVLVETVWTLVRTYRIDKPVVIGALQAFMQTSGIRFESERSSPARWSCSSTRPPTSPTAWPSPRTPPWMRLDADLRPRHAQTTGRQTLDHTMTELAKSFEPAAIEAHWAPLWEPGGVYAPTLDPAKPSFSIQLPPPNVTGTLHMGHAFNHTIMDALTRYHRMRGFNTLWLPGTDHAGIATQIVVERQLQDAGPEPPRHRPQELHRPRVGVEGAQRQHHHRADAPHGRHGGLVARVLHDGRHAVGASSPRPSCGCTKRA